MAGPGPRKQAAIVKGWTPQPQGLLKKRKPRAAKAAAASGSVVAVDYAKLAESIGKSLPSDQTAVLARAGITVEKLTVALPAAAKAAADAYPQTEERRAASKKEKVRGSALDMFYRGDIYIDLHCKTFY